jgi:uncharacterized membrane protein YcaP (DUF421 family)
MVRVAGRSPGKQRTPADFVIVFFMGGVTLTSMVGNDRSLSNAVTIVLGIAATHYCLVWLKQWSPAAGRIIDGTPLVLYERGNWQKDVMKHMSIHETDVMAAVRDKGMRGLEEVRYAVLERNGEISIIANGSGA